MNNLNKNNKFPTDNIEVDYWVDVSLRQLPGALLYMLKLLPFALTGLFLWWLLTAAAFAL
jgi:hypothetical protein|tara:strand:- start:573 stop:752 length:180 start_codon:yes stop_codon:yes gene_type:complete